MVNVLASIPGRRRRDRVSADEEAEIIRLYLERHSTYQICKAMNRGYDAVRRVINDHPDAVEQMKAIEKENPGLKRPYKTPELTDIYDADAVEAAPLASGDMLLDALIAVHGCEARFGGPLPSPPNATIDVKFAGRGGLNGS